MTLTGIASGATVNVYYKTDSNVGTAGDPAYDSTFSKQTFTAHEDSTTANYQVTLTGLTSATDYEIYVSQTTNGDESANKANTEESTNADAVPTVTDAIANDINDGVGTTNQVLVTFSEAVNVLDASGFTVNPNGQSFTLNGTSASKANTSGTKSGHHAGRVAQRRPERVGPDL